MKTIFEISPVVFFKRLSEEIGSIHSDNGHTPYDYLDKEKAFDSIQD